MNIEAIAEQIRILKTERNAVILAHNYQIGEVQEAADFVGDSLDLSRKAAEVEEDVIVFAGVHFMAETASILAPDKTVLLPDRSAGCPMADMITAEELRRWKADFPGRTVICYVNTSAEVKAECDICCTSANALQVVEAAPGNEILFVPDRNLASWVARKTEKKIIPWDGYCYVHNNIFSRDVEARLKEFPEAGVWVHPECRPEVIDLADKVLSTGQMVREAGLTDKKQILVGTEAEMTYRLHKENPEVSFIPIKASAYCRNMKKTNLNKILRALKEMEYKISVSREIAERARGSIEKMVQL